MYIEQQSAAQLTYNLSTLIVNNIMRLHNCINNKIKKTNKIYVQQKYKYNPHENIIYNNNNQIMTSRNIKKKVFLPKLGYFIDQ